MDGHPPPPSISSEDLKPENPPEPATNSVMIPDLDSVILPIIVIIPIITIILDERYAQYISKLYFKLLQIRRHEKSGKCSASRFAFSHFRLGEIPNSSLFSEFFR